MDPSIECVGFSADALTPEQRSALNAFVQGHEPGDLVRLRVYPNVDTTAAVPNGVVAYYRPEATVDAGALNDSMFERVSVAPLIRGPPEADYNLKELSNAVLQTVDEPLTGEVRRLANNEDDRPWQAELGGPRSFVGVYSQLNADGRTKTYKLVGRGTAPAYVQDFKRAVAKLKPTYGDLMTDPDWQKRVGFGVNGAARTVHRNMAAAAEALGATVLREDDHSARDSFSEMAVPEWTQVTHALRAENLDGRPLVAVAHGVTPAAETVTRLGDDYYVVGSPYDGIYAFPISRFNDLRAAGGLPADTGRYVSAAEVPDDESLYEGRSQGIVWEGPSQVNADLHPAAFRPVDAKFKSSLKRMGWNAEDHEGRLVPVCVKIHDPKLINV